MRNRNKGMFATWMKDRRIEKMIETINTYWRRTLRNKSYRYGLISIVLLFIMYTLFNPSSYEIRLPDYVDARQFPPFEPQLTSDFDLGDGTEGEIPQIIHQTWMDETIPSKFVNNIKSFVEFNPSWDYYLWTDQDLTQLVKKHFPDFLPVWENYVYAYHHRLRRFNAARYLIMYVYGGVYVDLDMVNYRPLAPAIQKNSCILPPEPYEHSYTTYMGYTLTNAIMFCKPKHPFFKFMIDNLSRHLHLSHSWDSAGPGYLTSQYRLYAKDFGEQEEESDTGFIQTDTRPFMVRKDFSLHRTNSIYIPNSRFFTGNSDTNLHKNLQKMCTAFDTLHNSLKRVCVDLKRRGLVRKRDKYTYTEHLWQNNWYGLSNFYIYTSAYSFFFGTNIQDIVPNRKIPFN